MCASLCVCVCVRVAAAAAFSLLLKRYTLAHPFLVGAPLCLSLNGGLQRGSATFFSAALITPTWGMMRTSPSLHVSE